MKKILEQFLTAISAIFGAFVLLIGLGMTIQSFSAGIIFMGMGLIFIPQFNKFIAHKINLKLSFKIKIGLFISGLITASLFLSHQTPEPYKNISSTGSSSPNPISSSPSEQIEEKVITSPVPSSPQTAEILPSSSPEPQAVTPSQSSVNESERIKLITEMAKDYSDCGKKVMDSEDFIALKNQINQKFYNQGEYLTEFIEGGAGISDVIGASERFLEGLSAQEVEADIDPYISKTTAKFYFLPSNYVKFITDLAETDYLPNYLKLVERYCLPENEN
ncbi:hypothetical protein [Laspinema palackyanum]|uniref:hypothetical protein n=1 Tax=Laspinema palackyanum TaxID=3231601 RepID=UPI00345D2923|nr:hypothetical protein [Laspinema sp. D2c]